MKVFFDETAIDKEYLSFLSPILGTPKNNIRGEEPRQIHDWNKKGREILKKCTKEECDYFVYPKYFRLDNLDEVKTYAKEAERYKKKVLVFSYGEIDDYIEIAENIIRYKRATKRNTHKQEYCLPPFPEDLLIYNNKEIPSIHKGGYSLGYVGYAKYTNTKTLLYYIISRGIGIICRIPFIKKILLRQKKEKVYGRLINAGIGNYCRGESIKYVQRQHTYAFNFIQRKHALTTDTKEKMREEYIQNMIKSDFPLVIRGFGNYSFRQYEAMSLGKIIVYIDTGAKLPFEDEIPYQKIYIKVPFHDVKNIEQYITKYIKIHGSELDTIQKEVRKIYEDYFTLTNYYQKIIKELSLS